MLNFWALDHNVAKFAHFQKLKIFNVNWVSWVSLYENIVLCKLQNFCALDHNVATFAHFQKLKIFNVNCCLSLDDDGTASSSGVSDNEGPKVGKIKFYGLCLTLYIVEFLPLSFFYLLIALTQSLSLLLVKLYNFTLWLFKLPNFSNQFSFSLEVWKIRIPLYQCLRSCKFQYGIEQKGSKK